MILDNLSIGDLTKVAAVNKVFSILAGDVFRRKLGKRFLHFYEGIPGSEKLYDENLETYTIYNNVLSLSVLEHFGSYIEKLIVDYPTDRYGSAKCIVSLVNQNCNNLNYFKLISYKNSSLEDVKKPFSSVNEVNIIGLHYKMGNSNFTFNKMFPNLKKLRFDVFLREYDGFFEPMPNLKHLSPEFGVRTEGIYKKVMRNLILNNPQIESITYSCNSSFLEFLSENLPKLKTIRIPKIYNIDHKNIQFKSVKTFEIGEIYSSKFINISFEQLEYLECDQYFINDIIQNNGKNLSGLTLNTVNYFSNENSSFIAQEAPNLNEATFYYSKEPTVDSIVHFLNENKNLNKFNLVIGTHYKEAQFSDDKVEELKTRIVNKWTIKSFKDLRVHFYVIQKIKL